MNYKAIDVVLLLSDDMTQRVLALNEQLVREQASPIVLGAGTGIPHITIMLGVVSVERIPYICADLGRIAREFVEFKLSAIAFETGERADGKTTNFKIEQTQELNALHKAVLDCVWPHLSETITPEMFAQPNEIEEITIDWVKSFPRYSVRKHYNPHITVGFGRINLPDIPISFTAPTLALCHLGNYNTCREILWSKQLLPDEMR